MKKNALTILCSALFALLFLQPLYAQISSSSAQVGGDVYGQPKVIDDMDGDGVKDLIFGATDGRIHVYSSVSGQEILRPPCWPKQTKGPILGSVQVVDIDKDGETDVVAASQDGTVYCLTSEGALKWKTSTGKDSTIKAATPEIVDYDGSGSFSILIGTGKRIGKYVGGSILNISDKGDILWTVGMVSPVNADVIARDVDGNGVKEVIAKDLYGTTVILNRNGASENGWAQSSNNSIDEWPNCVDAADINGDGIKEIYTTDSSGVFYMWDISGKLISKFKSGSSFGAPQIADIDGDGQNDIIVAASDGSVCVFDKTGKPKKGWPSIQEGSIYAPPQIIDIDGDGRLDIVITAWNPGVDGLKAGFITVLDSKGGTLDGYPQYIGRATAKVSFADLDDDGYLEMIAAGGINYSGEQIRIFKTKARSRIKMAVMGQWTTF